MRYYYVAVQRPAIRSMKQAHSTSVLDIGSVISKEHNNEINIILHITIMELLM